MGRKTGKDEKRGKKGLGLEDLTLWKAFTRDIIPLEEPDWDVLEEGGDRAPAPKSLIFTERPAHKPPVQVKPVRALEPPQLDARTESKLKRGRLPIEGRMDLHGMTQDEAHPKLNDFILRAHHDGKRCVLVITGKGGGGLQAKDWFSPNKTEGVLKQKLPLWLSMHPLRDVVLKTTQASPKDGGGGAFYIYLKRQRDYRD